MTRAWLLCSFVAIAIGCSGSKPATGSGGASATGGSSETGGASATGGANGSGGESVSGGQSGTATGGAGMGTTGGAGPIGSGGARTGGSGPNTGGRAGATGGSGSGGSGSGGAPQADAGTPDGGRLPPTSLAVRFADSIIQRWPDPGNIGGVPFGWDYNLGIVLSGIQKVFERTQDAKYLAYIRKYVDAHVNAQGRVDISANAPHSLDLIQPAGLLLFLKEQVGDAKYDTAAQQIRTRFDSFPKNADGGFWHKQQYPNEMWLDGIYMAEPFLMKFGRLFPSCGAYCDDTPVTQLTLVAGHTQNATTGLFVHGWDQDKTAAWANPTTGNSPEVWGRGQGWMAMALVDLLDMLPATHAGRAQLLALLRSLATGLKNTQDATTGLWYQVVDKGTMAGNYLETSGSGMYVYALKVGVTRGYLDSSFLAVAQKGYDGMKSKVTDDAMGLPVISDAVKGMGVQVDYASYVNQTSFNRLSNSPHGLCAILMAASQMD